MVGALHYCNVARSTCKYCCLSSAFGCFLSPLLMTNKKKKKDREKEKERERANKKAVAISFSSTAAGFSFCQAH